MTDSLRQRGAVLAGDGIPLHYGDQAAEFTAALNAAILMDRSHEGRLSLRGPDRLALVQRMSTNDMLALAVDEAAPTIFTNPIGRILDRVTLVNRAEDALLLAGPGRGEALRAYLQRHIFFTDQVQVADLAPNTRHFVLAGPQAAAIAVALAPALAGLDGFGGSAVEIADVPVYAVRVKPLRGSQWSLIVPGETAEAVFEAALATGESFGLLPAGSLVYNALRIRAGIPGTGRELSTDYIPLEVGLWDEVSFRKGCYTGQEIIARMESRGKLAKTIVQVTLDRPIEAPAALKLDGREVGTLTSSAATPDGSVCGIAVVKVTSALPGAVLQAVRENTTADATITGLAGVQPGGLAQE
ncbi:MAG: folate-binding protein YgfZ, partial [Anaerolineae bacterium]|nr:folate-binding protein YgfZ [Anaerolineae bacterium]